MVHVFSFLSPLNNCHTMSGCVWVVLLDFTTMQSVGVVRCWLFHSHCTSCVSLQTPPAPSGEGEPSSSSSLVGRPGLNVQLRKNTPNSSETKHAKIVNKAYVFFVLSLQF